jgi:hypothetical protein
MKELRTIIEDSPESIQKVFIKILKLEDNYKNISNLKAVNLDKTIEDKIAGFISKEVSK